MIGQTQIRKPKNWQDFEKLCKKLWGEVWQCSDTIQLNGRSGQNQNGIDVYGIPKGKSAYYGIQCKAKDEYTDARLTPAIIDAEIEKAMNFKPQLERMIFATTANKDVSIEEYIRKKNIGNIKAGNFEVYLSAWDDIVYLMEAHVDTYRWYLNDCQYKDSSDVNIVFDNSSDMCTINPQYVRTTKRTILKEMPAIPDGLKALGISLQQWSDMQKPWQPDEKLMQTIRNISNQSAFGYNRSKTDYHWCSVKIKIENTGSTTLEDYKLYLEMENISDVLDLDCGFHYKNNIYISGVEKAQINSNIDKRRNVFLRSDDSIMFEPKSSLVQTDSIGFKFLLKPKDGVEEIVFLWSFKSRDYHKEGKLLIKVIPKYEDKDVILKVDDKSLLEEPIINIEPKIL